MTSTASRKEGGGAFPTLQAHLTFAVMVREMRQCLHHFIHIFRFARIAVELHEIFDVGFDQHFLPSNQY